MPQTLVSCLLLYINRTLYQQSRDTLLYSRVIESVGQIRTRLICCQSLDGILGITTVNSLHYKVSNNK